MNGPRLSIVIPTHNRAERLGRALDALARQDWPLTDLEILVVADGCSDATPAAVAAGRPGPPVRLLSQAAAGPAAARNRGAAEARGSYLLFLDDDIVADPGLVRAHLEEHRLGGPRQVVIGYLPARVPGNDFFSTALRGWWDAMFQAMWKPGHRFTFRDLLSGNFSIERALFEEVGGFDVRLRCHEDYELGLRLIEADARFRFAAAALGIHEERTDLAMALRRKFEEGRADVWLLRERPHLLEGLPLAYMQADTRRRRVLQWLAANRPSLGDAVASRLWRPLSWYERLRLRYRWRALLEDLMFYWYLRGAAAAGARPMSGAQRRIASGDAPLEIELEAGLDAAERRLDIMRPTAVRLSYKSIPVGDIPAVPGAERLRGEHLRPALAEPLVEPYLRALALAGDLPVWIDVGRILAECKPPDPAAATSEPASAAT